MERAAKWLHSFYSEQNVFLTETLKMFSDAPNYAADRGSCSCLTAQSLRGGTQCQQKAFFSLSKNTSFVPMCAHICTSLPTKVPLQAAAPRCAPAGACPGFATLSLDHFIPRSWNNRTAPDPNLAAEADSADFCFLPLCWCALQFGARQLPAISGKLPAGRKTQGRDLTIAGNA